MEQPAVVLPEPLTVGAHLVAVAIGPEPPEVLGSRRTAETVETRELRVLGDGGEVRAVAGDGSRIVGEGTGEIERLGRGATGGESGSRPLE
jgi:hypothetical protein